MSKFRGIDASKVTGVVFAGSNGFSYDGAFMPKSLLEVNGKTLLEYTVERMIKLKLLEIYVFCDDNAEKYESILAKYKDVKLMVCDNYDSTFFIVQNHISFFNGEYILFLYGNSPNSTKHLEKLMINDMVVSEYAYSTKKNIIKVNDKFIEPPYFLKRSIVYDSAAITWLTFFAVNKDKITFVQDPGPCEFNTEEEFIEYKNYIKKNF